MNSRGRGGGNLRRTNPMFPRLLPLAIALAAAQAAAAPADPGAPVLSAAPAIGQISGSRLEQLKTAGYV